MFFRPKHTVKSVAKTLVEGLQDGSIILTPTDKGETMPRRLHCPYCDSIVEYPHRPGIECPTAPPPDVENPEGVQFRGPRDDEGRPIGEAIKPDGTRVKPTYRQPTTTQENIPAKKTNHDT